MQLKVLSWNIWIEGHFDQIADFLKNSDADIVGLQEARADDPEREIIKYLDELGYKHSFAPIAKEWGGKVWKDGPAIFSKYDIVETKTFILSEVNGRAAVQTDIRAGDKILHVFSTHLLHTHQQQDETQLIQIENLIKVLPSNNTIVMGDFNATPDSATIQKIRGIMIDTDPASSPTWSVYPEGCGKCNPQAVDTRLDYIFVSRDIKTSSFKVENSRGSDHLPISTIIEI
ncbi:MAG: endonuclease/exonuclease/phosphatase family protein [Candidatus Liptonbacteria bacterium]|nr:endonuclease/exonuclease/phosphatase family protein [Candidatus Liptonbacteria bacterium]